jgi:hypothetical protein
MAGRSLLKKAFFYACVEFLSFFYAYVEKFYAYGHAKRFISAHSMSALTLELTPAPFLFSQITSKGIDQQLEMLDIYFT